MRTRIPSHVAPLRTFVAGLCIAASPIVVASPSRAASATASGLLSVTTTAPDTAAAGAPFTVTVVATNNTAAPLAEVSATASFLRSALQARSISSPTAGAFCEKATFRGTNGYAACGNVTLAPGQSVVTNVTFIASATGPVDIGSYGFTVVSDPVARNVFEFAPAVTVGVTASTDLQLGGSASTGSPARGATYAYNFSVRNVSSNSAAQSVFTASVPAAVTAASSSVGGCSVTGGSVTCPIGTIGAAQQVRITVTAVAPSTAGRYAATGSVTSDTPDTKPADNTTAVTVTVK